MAFYWLAAGLALGVGIGATGMWLHLMNRHGGRRVDWRAMTVAAVVTFAIVAAIRAFQ